MCQYSHATLGRRQAAITAIATATYAPANPSNPGAVWDTVTINPLADGYGSRAIDVDRRNAAGNMPKYLKVETVQEATEASVSMGCAYIQML